MNYIASANAVIYCGGTPHFIDVEEKTLGPDAEKLDKYLKKSQNLKMEFYSINALEEQLNTLSLRIYLGMQLT